MELSPKQQTVELIKSAKKIIVLAHEHPDGDALGSMLALSLALKKLGKEVIPICQDPIPLTLQFLPSLSLLQKQPKSADEFVITLDTTAVEIDKLGYKNYPEQKKLRIVVKTKQGSLSPEMVSLRSEGLNADLTIALDTHNLERLGATYENYPTLFYETPIVNIDHHPGNEYFGRVNWVDLTATSTAEILVALLESLGSIDQNPTKQPLIDADIATLLLTGLITDTGSFQNSNTTPKSFTVAAQLVAGGGRQQEIIDHVFRTRRLSTLKLWGTILAKATLDQEYRFVWSYATKNDFAAAGAEETESAGVIDELLKTVSGADFALLLTEKGNQLTASLRGIKQGALVAHIATHFGGGGHQMAAAFRIDNASIETHAQTVLAQIRQLLRTRMNGQFNNSAELLENDISPNQLTVPTITDTQRQRLQTASKRLFEDMTNGMNNLTTNSTDQPDRIDLVVPNSAVGQ